MDDYDDIAIGDVLALDHLRAQLAAGGAMTIENVTRRRTIAVRHMLSARQIALLVEGGLINWIRARIDRGRRS